MPTIPLHPRPLSPSSSLPTNPLPPLLHTPSGLALLELQGSIRFPPTPAHAATNVGKLVFPLYDPHAADAASDTKWMKRVYFYVGKNQRMAGEVRRLGAPVAVVGRRVGTAGEAGVEGEEGRGKADGGEELEIVEVVKYKVVFSVRPEPVGGEVGGEMEMEEGG